ncbi:MAG: ShlB/FhaC/HecB family hemolysin secretion/activation protein [Methylophilaceae bacterium]|nr:ShlB/FhaC/HecB family hemolysin secretion/activation protein [Methylophilaceae bacterium]
MRKTHLKELVLLLSIFFSGQLMAEQVPDSGRLLREQPKAPTLTPSTPQELLPRASDGQIIQDIGPKFLVKGFRIEGATLISEEELQQQLEDSVGQELGFYQLQRLASRLTSYYSDKGYLARIILPPQDVENGIVIFKVIEGQRGNLRIENKGVRLDAERVGAFIDYRIARGDKFDFSALSSALNVLNEQPGIEVKSRIVSGEAESDVDVLVSAEDTPLTRYLLSTSNHGSRGTGEPQITGSVVFNNPFGLFDAASVLLNVAEGSRFLRGEYSMAIGNSGLRASVNASGLDYDIIQSSLKSLDARGNAITAGAGLSYPLIRRTNLSLNLSGNYDHKILRDYALGIEIGDRDIDAFNIGLVGSRIDGFMGYGQTGFAISLGAGDVNLSNTAAKAADSISRRTEGQYTKLSYYFSRNQLLSNRWSLAANLSGQFAGDNLDSTERFALGGPNGVRAYPVGEATGDEGWLASLNLTYTISENLNAVAFVDGGGIRLNKNTWANWNAGNPRLDNTYSLAGGGFALNWILAEKFALNAIIATPFGNNPGRDSNGDDSDSRSLGVRGWVSLTTTF